MLNLQNTFLRLNEIRFYRAMHYCASHSNEQVLEVLVSRDRSAVDMPDNNGQTPLYAAVIAGNLKVVESLLNLGAKVNALDKQKHSPAHWAVGLYPLRRMSFRDLCVFLYL